MQTIIKNNRPVLIIPAYQPNKYLQELITRIVDECKDQEIIIVNDGSTTDEAASVFEFLAKFKQVSLLHHQQNMGKGQALKTAFEYYLSQQMTLLVL